MTTTMLVIAGVVLHFIIDMLIAYVALSTCESTIRRGVKWFTDRRDRIIEGECFTKFS